MNCRVMTTLMRNGRDRRSGKPVKGHAILSARFWLGPDQRITSGPAATAAASRRGKPLREKQAAYMAAPERFADRSDSSCTAGAVHTWPITTCCIGVADGRFQGKADSRRSSARRIYEFTP